MINIADTIIGSQYGLMGISNDINIRVGILIYFRIKTAKLATNIDV